MYQENQKHPNKQTKDRRQDDGGLPLCHHQQQVQQIELDPSLSRGFQRRAVFSGGWHYGHFSIDPFMLLQHSDRCRT
jgi:hypothetical protein